MMFQSILPFFSGTGGTKYAAELLYTALTQKSHTAQLLPISSTAPDKAAGSILPETDTAELVVLLFPVHALDAPEPVYSWLHSFLEHAANKETLPRFAIVSVSGGGLIWPNTYAHTSLIEYIETNGFTVLYENMVVLPSNWTFATPGKTAAALLQLLPQRVEEISEGLISAAVNNKTQRFPERKKPGWAKLLSRKEQEQAHIFGNNLQANPDSCISCGLCANNCPSDSISMQGGKPVFGNSCVLCLGCIYRCPVQAIVPGKYSWMILKSGYSLKAYKELADNSGIQPDYKEVKGLLWLGVRKYLKSNYHQTKA